MAAEPGFEPGLRDPESRVLPLHHSATVIRPVNNTTANWGARQNMIKYHLITAHSSSGLGHRPLKAEITGSNPVCATRTLSACTVLIILRVYKGDLSGGKPGFGGCLGWHGSHVERVSRAKVRYPFVFVISYVTESFFRRRCCTRLTQAFYVRINNPEVMLCCAY